MNILMCGTAWSSIDRRKREKVEKSFPMTTVVLSEVYTRPSSVTSVCFRRYTYEGTCLHFAIDQKKIRHMDDYSQYTDR